MVAFASVVYLCCSVLPMLLHDVVSICLIGKIFSCKVIGLEIGGVFVVVLG